jgi:hypothetical protein
MKLLASTAAMLLEKEYHVDILHMDDNTIVAKTQELLGADEPELLAQLKERFGEDFDKTFSDLTYGQITRIYARHAQNTELMGAFIDYEEKNAAPETPRAEIEEGAQLLYNEFIFSVREVLHGIQKKATEALGEEDASLHDKNITWLSTKKITEEAVEKDISLASMALNTFKANSTYLKNALPDLFTSEQNDARRNFENILLSELLEAAKIEHHALDADVYADVHMKSIVLGEVFPLFQQLEYKDLVSPSAALLALSAPDFEFELESLRLMANTENAFMCKTDGADDCALLNLLAVALDYHRETPDGRETQRRVEEGEGRGST